jgi:diketogulonate reductase-like aldo/keto reductase
MIETIPPPCSIHAPDRRRRRLVQGLSAIPLLASLPAMPADMGTLLRRPIPRGGEQLPVIGLGTYMVLDVAAEAPEMAELREVLREFVAAGASVIDSSPMYGRAEARVGDLAGALGIHSKLFLATKVWTSGRQAGIDQMRASMKLMRTQKLDLIQVHNLLDVATHTKTLREWKQAGTLRYLGITHYHSGAYAELERLLKTREYDFVQFNYSLAERDAEARLLGVAADTGTAVIVNRPFAQGELFPRVRGKSLPAWAADFDCASWAQFFLKYIIGHPAVTCVIPGTGKLGHLHDNLKAGAGRLPDAHMRQRMAEHIGTL